jgi:hypothetical protein
MPCESDINSKIHAEICQNVEVLKSIKYKGRKQVILYFLKFWYFLFHFIEVKLGILQRVAKENVFKVFKECQRMYSFE